MASLRHYSILAVSALLGAGALSPEAHADAANVLYVNNAASAGCADSGQGTSAQPYCTIQAAADAVVAGQTIQVAPGSYAAFSLTRSGTPSAPITIQGAWNNNGPSVYVGGSGGHPAVSLSGVHDVRVNVINTHDDPSAQSDSIDVSNAQNVTLDRVAVYLTGSVSSSASAALRVAGSSGVSVTHADVENQQTGSAVRIESGSSGVDVASDVISSNNGPAVSVSGAGSTDVVGDQLVSGPASVVAVDGGSSAVVVENDTLMEFFDKQPPSPLVAVAADSTTGVHEDYNALPSSPAGGALYDWGGTSYATPAAFTSATGQGVHDLGSLSETLLTSWVVPEGSPLIDSADANAPGELSTDYQGNPRVDDTTVTNSGTGPGYYDRGAFEFQDPIGAPALSPSSAQGIAPFALSVGSGPETPWQEPLTVKVDFGDGSAPVSGAAGTAVTHTYTTPGTYTETTTTTDSGGSTHVSTHGVVVGTSAAPQATLSATAEVFTQGQVNPGDMIFDASGTPDTWEIASEKLDFGDGSSPVDPRSSSSHGYLTPGVYTARLTVTDDFGRTSTAATQVVVGDELWPTTPSRTYDSRWSGLDSVPARSVVRVQLKNPSTQPHFNAFAVNVTVTDTEAPGFVTAYPSGQARPTASTVNFAAHQTIANQTTVLVGADGYVDFYNGSGKPISLIVDTLGIQAARSIAYAYQPLTPTRVLDTRTTGHAVTGHGTTTFQVAGLNGVPADAKAVLLNVTATNTHSAGFLSAYGDGQPKPNISNTNWTTGQTIAGLALVYLQDGKVTLYNGGSGPVDFVADLAGYYSTNESSTVYLPVAPSRVLDTRYGVGAPAGQLAAHQAIRVQIAGRAGTYAPGAAAAMLTFTVTGGTAAGDLIVYPDGSSRPGTSTINWGAGQTLSNSAMTSLGADGWIDIYNAGSKPISVITDLAGIDYLYSAPAS
jgi:PKD repeat protein